MSYRLLAAVSVYWFGLSMLLDGLTALYLPHELLARADGRGSATLLGLITFGGIFLGMAAQPLAGTLSDRGWADRRALMTAGGGLAVLGLLLMGIGGGLALLAGYLLAIVAANVGQAGQQALVPDRVPHTWRGRAAGVKGLLDVAGASASFVLLAALLGAGQRTGALVLLAACLLGTLAAALALLPRDAAPHAQAPARIPVLFGRILAARFLFLLGIYMVGRFLVLFVADRLGLGADAAAAQAGLVLAMLALLSAVASIPAGWAADRFGRRATMVGGAAVGATGIALLAIAGDAAGILLFGGLMAIGSSAFGAGSWALLTDVTPGSDAGRLMGIANVATAGAAGVAGLAGPMIDTANAIRPGAGFVALLALSAVCALAGGRLSLGLGVDERRQLDAA
jgi:MFS family permease